MKWKLILLSCCVIFFVTNSCKADEENIPPNEDSSTLQIDNETSIQYLQSQFQLQSNGAQTSSIPKNCARATQDGIQLIQIPYSNVEPFNVVCDTKTQDGKWTVIQRRLDGSVDFYRPWSEYKNGFGNLNGEFWIGLDKLQLMTAYQPQELLVVLTDFSGVTKYAKYDIFEIGTESELYYLKQLGTCTGTAGDSLAYHKMQKFSTYDRDNDSDARNCASLLQGGWWYASCRESNLNGLYLPSAIYYGPANYGTDWLTFNKSYWYSLKTVVMMIRPVNGYP